jgi:nicotinic acid mononucleotide adenylyltransferase
VYYKGNLALEFIHRGGRNPKRVALFPGTWNPPTIAHIDIAQMTLREVDEVVWILPRALPHKKFDGAAFEARCGMLKALVREHTHFSAAVSDSGLYVDIAREARDHFRSKTKIVIVLGRDAAERIAGWDYGTPGVFDDLVRRHRLLVAARNGEYQPDRRHGGRISRLAMDAAWDEVSSSEVRRRIALGEDWQHLVHPAISGHIEHLYLEAHAGAGKAVSHRSAEREPRPDSRGGRGADAGTVGIPPRRGPVVDRGVPGARDTGREQDLRPRRKRA